MGNTFRSALTSWWRRRCVHDWTADPPGWRCVRCGTVADGGRHVRTYPRTEMSRERAA